MQFQKTQLALALSALLVSASFSGAANAATGYEVTELEPVTGALSFSVTSMNNSGNYTGIGYNLADILIRTELLDPENFEGIEDFNELSASEYMQLRNYLLSTNGSLADSTAQKLSSLRGVVFQGMNMSLNEDLDTIEPATGLLSQSNDVLLHDINEQNQVVGEHRAPFIQQEGVNGAGEPVQYFVRDRYPHGLWSNGVDHVELPAEPGLTYGGLSRAYAINDHNQVVGYAAVADNDRIVAAYEKCSDPESETAHLPLKVCMHTAWFSERFAQVITAPLYTEQAYTWTLDATGTVVSQTTLGAAPTLLDEQEDVAEEDRLTGVVRSEAVDINNQGVAVGFTSLRNEFFVLSYATVFKDGEALWVLPRDTEGFTQSRATHINDNGYIVGDALIRNFQFNRKRLFVAHVDGREPVFPDGHFSHSAWEARDLNNLNQVVGRAERDRTLVQNRPTSAFLYDIETDTLTDLNSQLACNSGYHLFDAVSINEHGDIVALANKEVTREIDGRSYTTHAVQPVLLRASDTVEACGDNTGNQERKGAALSPMQFAMAATLSVFAVFSRRRRKAKK
ncbi:hypothetical protein CWE15_03010 [Aliidiomarina taiwanensis]|uniref:DUF3466 family protein n=1 Tax=Aliidiomarina taiwanensis TaxID=946228 RepID=A0A432XA88_9GAMM|nr:DUF3466 family protein [Aliidiomarina taiwanensis]RUO44151.1 hypothetical protein CWE15_03010 [Aliidiomarina taiwanensis]